MKILDEARCNSIIKGNLKLYKTNLELLTSKKQITIRIPFIGHYTDDDGNKLAIINEIKKFKKSILKIELIKGHNLGESKYKSLDLLSPQYFEVTDYALMQYKKKLEECTKIPVEICKI